MSTRPIAMAAILPLTLLGCRGLAGFDDLEPIEEPAPPQPCGEAGLVNAAGACQGPGMQLSTQFEHTCVLMHDGEVWCWGCMQTFSTQETPKFWPAPTRIEGLPGRATHIGVGYGHGCAVVESGDIWCWGNNAGGQLGSETEDDFVWSAIKVLGVEGIEFKEVYGGRAHTCALSKDSDVYCWGHNSFGQCGRDDSEGIVLPTNVAVISGVDKLESQRYYNCVRNKKNLSLYCWGDNEYGTLGLAPDATRYTHVPQKIAAPEGEDVADFALGMKAAYAIFDWQVWAWGTNDDGQLGIGDYAKRPWLKVKGPWLDPQETLMDVGGEEVPLVDADGVFAGNGQHACAMLRNSPVGHPYVCWGDADWGELGYGFEEFDTYDVAQKAPAIPEDGRGMVLGDDHGCIIAPGKDGGLDDVWCWGRADQMGRGEEWSCPMPDDSEYKEARPVAETVLWTN